MQMLDHYTKKWIKYANVKPLYKKVDPFDKNQRVYYPFYKKFMKE